MNEQFFTLANNVKIPVIGFGTWQIPAGDVAYNSVMSALKYGYRHIDTAMAYKNEESVGQAIKDSNINRKEIFVTTKLPAAIKGYQETLDSFEQSLKNLGLDYVDLYLIHAPKPWGLDVDAMEYMDKNIETWKAFEKLYKDKKIRSIGVSNFLPDLIEELIKNAEIVPMVNQINVNPTNIPHNNIEYCKEHNILVEAYSPLATGRIIDNYDLKLIAKKYNKSVAQICIRWSYQYGLLPLPKSITDTRIIENLKIFDFEIDDNDMRIISNLH